ncbi:MAG: carbohydrate kinase [Proteiniphilum sp.]|nr:carbohydrate kinase [Proteiniphilum sp.]
MELNQIKGQTILKRKPVIIGIGELLWDMLPSGKKVGGAPVNFVYHASGAGAESYAISTVGNDLLGDEIMMEIEKGGIHHLVERVDYPTSTVRVELMDGIPNYTIIENVAWDHMPLTEAMMELAGKADAVCFGTLAQRSAESRSTIQKMLSLVPPSAYRIFDINLRQHFFSEEIIIDSLNRCNVFKINKEELAIVKEMFNVPESEEKESCQWFVEKFDLKFMILTAGADYSLIVTPESDSLIRTPRVKVVDTVGAGDSFTGAFISAILSGRSIKEAHRSAVDRSAFVCTQAGAWV